MKRIRMKKKISCSLILVLVGFASVVRASDVSDVRNTVQTVFDQLKSRNYEGLYDLLPD